MKKIMFNDKYGLTKAVLEGRKTCTRRVVPEKMIEAIEELNPQPEEAVLRTWLAGKSPYKVGEVLAVAQSYSQVYAELLTRPEITPGAAAGFKQRFGSLPAWKNKMFVNPYEMYHRIEITGVRVEELQDITDEDCLREGIYQELNGFYTFENWTLEKGGVKFSAGGPRGAFEALINKISGRWIWDEDPLVYVYDFKLVK